VEKARHLNTPYSPGQTEGVGELKGGGTPVRFQQLVDGEGGRKGWKKGGKKPSFRNKQNKKKKPEESSWKICFERKRGKLIGKNPQGKTRQKAVFCSPHLQCRQ